MQRYGREAHWEMCPLDSGMEKNNDDNKNNKNNNKQEIRLDTTFNYDAQPYDFVAI